MRYFTATFCACIWMIHVQAQTLNYYFGNIHAHTSYSDGNKDSASSLMTRPYQAFQYAKQSQHIDFYGISEHNHESAGIKSPVYYKLGLRDADSSTVDGQFVAMYGMEWGVISTGGHVLVYGVDSLCGWDFSNTEIHINEGDYTALWKLINRKKAAFGYLAHPSSGDYGDMLSNAATSIADKAVTGTAMRSGPAFSTNSSYTNPSTSTYLSFFNAALRNGFHVAPGIDHDTHNSVFGRQSKGRLAVLAPILNRAELIDAMRRRRMYASDDWNAKLNFTISSQPMGSILENTTNPILNVQLLDADNETASSIVVYAGVPGSGVNPTVLTSVTNTNTLNYTHNIADGSSYYYYVYVTQADGDKIWSAPIWYSKNSNLVVQTPVANFASNLAACKGFTYSLTDSSSSNVVSWWWNIPGATPANSSLQNPEVVFASSGSYNVTLTVTNVNGMQSSITKVIQVLDPPSIQVTATNDSICRGNSTWLLASGASNYVWFNNVSSDSLLVTPQSTTTYTVKSTFASCVVKASVKVNVYQAMVTPIVSIVGDSISSTYASGNVWFHDGSIDSSLTSGAFLPLENGFYYCYAVDSNGCRSTTSNMVQYNKVGIAEKENELQAFVVFPNPSSGILHLTPLTDARIESLEMMDMSGKRVLQSDVEHKSFETFDAEIGLLANGLYTLEIHTNKGVFKKQISLKK